MTAIKEIDDSALCISRRKFGRGYRYFQENGTQIKEEKTLRRLKGMVIPPMWNDVMICRFDDGHIQAIGRDQKGRKQYIYHSIYEKQRQEEKFRKMHSFANVLPRIRKKAYQELKAKEWTREKILGLIILILDEYGIRIGNKQYRDRNDTYGLTTLRRKHMEIEDDELIFQFKGKSKQLREVHIDDPHLIPFIKEAASLPGYEIFRYQDTSGNFHDVDSDEVNEYIAQHMGEDFSSKDFRTWAASRLAVEFYPEALEQQKKTQRRKFSNIVIKMVASELGNTPSVCKNYYVHPAIFNEIDQQTLAHPNPFKEPKSAFKLSASEQLALEVIDRNYRKS
ncbi:MAG: DNA topoisomerase IB [Flavobacteriales bacterium]